MSINTVEDFTKDFVWLLEQRDEASNHWLPVSLGSSEGAMDLADKLVADGVNEWDIHISIFLREGLTRKV